MVKNDPKVIAHLLRAIAGSTDAARSKQDIIFNAAANLLDPSVARHGGVREAIDRGGGQCCDVDGVLRELTKAGYTITPAGASTVPSRDAIANAILAKMPTLGGLNAALDAIMALMVPTVREDVISYYSVREGYIFKRPVRTGAAIAAGFPVCLVCDGVDAEQVCAILNRGDPVTE